MQEDGSVIRSEPMGIGQFTIGERGLPADELSSTTGLCESEVLGLLTRIGTRPGPDEEVIVDVKIRKRPIRDR